MREEYITTSHSNDATFESCARRFEFIHFYLKTPEMESDTYAADVGTALHEATQAWQRVICLNGDHGKAYDKGLVALANWWPWTLEDQRRANSKPIGERTLGNAVLMFEAIINSSIWEEWELVRIEGFGPAIEVPFRIVHKSLGKVKRPDGKEVYFATQGKIDFILRHKKTGVYRVLDLKTTEKSLPSHDATFRFSGQAGQYGMVLSHAIGLDWMTHGLDVVYLIAYFDPEEGPRAYPIPYHLDPEEVQDSIDLKVERLSRMKQYAERQHWPRRAHGCEFFGTPCGFLDICHRRDVEYIREWLEFEEANGRFKKYSRVYEPVWVLEA